MKERIFRASSLDTWFSIHAFAERRLWRRKPAWFVAPGESLIIDLVGVAEG
jgi:hypothetical protein